MGSNRWPGGREREVSIALLHYPVYNRNREVVVSSVTNLDIHDIARVARTYRLARYYVVTPLDAQRALVARIQRHWTKGFGARYNTTREEAFRTVDVKGSLEEVLEDIRLRTGREPTTVATGARPFVPTSSYGEVRQLIRAAGSDSHFLILFGTAWGVATEIVCRADYVLDPVEGKAPYNHLSVRSAAAIILDRLFGERDGELSEGG